MSKREWLRSNKWSKKYPEYVMELTTQMKILTPLKELSTANLTKTTADLARKMKTSTQRTSKKTSKRTASIPTMAMSRKTSTTSSWTQ